MMMKGFERSDKQFEDLARMFARGFERIDHQFGALQGEFGQFKKETNENFTKVRRDILEIGDKYISRDEFSRLVNRFNILEAKIKAKK